MWWNWDQTASESAGITDVELFQKNICLCSPTSVKAWSVGSQQIIDHSEELGIQLLLPASVAQRSTFVNWIQNRTVQNWEKEYARCISLNSLIFIFKNGQIGIKTVRNTNNLQIGVDDQFFGRSKEVIKVILMNAKEERKLTSAFKRRSWDLVR